MNIGKVSWFNEAKGYGEIISIDNDVYFFSYNDIVTDASWKSIKTESKVQFSKSSATLFNHPKAVKIKELKQ